MKIARNFWLTAALAVLPLAACAGAVDDLKRFLHDTRTFQADFTQTLVTRSGRAPQASSGSVALQRPGKLRWEIRQPVPQLVVGDGEKIWMHDPELEQVTVRPAGQALGGTPAALLAGSGDLERDFQLVEAPAAEGLAWVDATPRRSDAGFERLRLGFAEGELRAMELFDSFGQVTRIRFSGVKRNPSLSAALFRFTPPPGVDVIGQ